MKEKIKKIKKFCKDNEEEIVTCVSVVMLLAIAATYYSIGRGITELKVANGLYRLHKSEDLHLYDPIRDEVVNDLDEFHKIVRYVDKH